MLPVQIAVPTRYAPVVNWWLIAINVGAFLFEISLSPPELEWFLSRFALVPARYFAPMAPGAVDLPRLDWLPFVSNMFLHGGWLHLVLNMWTLWLFGPIVEDRLGSGRYLAFYLACGLVASVTHVAFNPTSTVPALGASGAIAGVLGASIVLFPLARLVMIIPILFFPFFFEVPAIFFAAIWFLTQLLQGSADLLLPTSDAGGVAWWAHVGGFVTGVVLTPVARQSAYRYRTYFADEGVLGFDPRGR